jgi:hypothetical protein
MARKKRPTHAPNVDAAVLRGHNCISVDQDRRGRELRGHPRLEPEHIETNSAVEWHHGHASHRHAGVAAHRVAAGVK